MDISDPQLEKVEIEVITEDLCSIYGCERCPGHVAGHEGHRIDSDASCNEGGLEV